ncbi:MAG TPA: glycosyltransferase family 4 protein, partial [Chitinophagaceae bacterium]
KKTLVILTPGFPKDEADSTCLPMQQQLIQTLLKNNPELSIIVLSFQYPYHTAAYTWFSANVIPFNGQNKGGLPRLLLQRKINATLKKIHNSTGITGILSFWYGECALVGKRFADKYNIKHFCWISGQDARKENKYPKRVSLKAGELIALSDFLQDEFEKNHGIRPQHIIPAGVDPMLFRNAGSIKDIDILAAGSLIPLKQYDIFLHVLAEIKKQLPQVKAMLVGEGSERKKLEALITQLGLQSTITLTGELSHAEVLQQMQRAKLFLHPSSYEGFSGVCLEALQSGAHVISFCKAMKEEIEHWHIVATKERMIQQALAILENPLTNYKQVTFHTMDQVAQKFLTLFR